MKKYNITSLVLGLTLLTSCSESFFEKYPTDATSFENYCRTSGEVQNVLYAAYGGLRDNFANAIVYTGDLPTDNAYCYKIVNSQDHITLHESGVASSNGMLGNLWLSGYQIINRCNLVIANMTGKFSSDAKFNQYVGEAKFIRAYAYYVMVRVFGDVPLVVEDIAQPMDVFNYGRESVSNVYVRIIDDLTDAISKLPDSYSAQSEIGRVTSTAAQAILADVYLTRRQYAEAKSLYEAIIAKEGAGLGLIDGAQYKSIFSAENVNNKEIIFAVRYAYAQTPAMSNYLMRASLGNVEGVPINPPGYTNSKIYGVNLMMMTTDLATLYETNDLRRSVVHMGLHAQHLQDTQYPEVIVPQTLKYFDYRNITDGRSGNGPESGCPTIISRYADIILKYAECLNETDPAAAIVQIKRIRDRAGVTTNINATKADVAAAIDKERRLELGMEGHRWFDMVRTGRAQEVMNAYYSRGAASLSYLPEYIADCEFGNLSVPATVANHELIYPIPYAQNQLNPDKLPQNPEY
ncbi:MAG: RagB/SusD family nutrient uptake outer membrane protein [Bacteroidales bacterium]|nr:RagB/SusD family nutrient uptake outer membrane protein [Bacteroidales bacterium]